MISSVLFTTLGGRTSFQGKNLRDSTPCDMSPEALNIDTWNSPVTPTYIQAKSELDRLKSEISKVGTGEIPSFKFKKVVS
jgi:hypothetical protein